MSASGAYGPVQKTVHRLVLGNRAVAETLFDLDQGMARKNGRPRVARPVFIAGLARAGTTIVLRRLHASGEFASLTYRHMPFVLAPNLARRIGGARKAGGKAAVERAHGDGILVNEESPESFDEVFWRTFDGPAYIRADRILPHAPDPELQWAYRRYVEAILAADGRAGVRYLSKNNNNALRLPALAEAFADALIIVPFRDPLAHAASLMRQHGRFTDIQADDPFARAYMDWLGHHEFGGGHRPFASTADEPLPAWSADALDYWLDLWARFYAFILDTAPPGALFLSHEALCADDNVWRRLADAAEIPGDAPTAEPFVARPTPEPAGASRAVVERANAVHDALQERAAARGPATPEFA